MQQLVFHGAHITEEHLAYVEWFTRFRGPPNPYHQMHKVTRLLQDGGRVVSIIPLSKIQGSIHLFPNYGRIAPREWTSSNVLEKCDTFYANPFTNRYIHVHVH